MASTLMSYLSMMKEQKTIVKVFIEGASPTQSKTMLSGKITSFDDEAIVLDQCLILLERVISIAPFH